MNKETVERKERGADSLRLVADEQSLVRSNRGLIAEKREGKHRCFGDSAFHDRGVVPGNSY
ncbi:MAG: hypothetical protein WC455_06945 [Dehalococcoidia bacterium]